MESNSTVNDENNDMSAELIDQIYFYVIPSLVLLGTLGNLLSLAVFRCTKLRRLSTSYYLTALSLSDTAFLISIFATWLETVGVNAYNQPFLCQFVTYISHVCSFLSPWLVVTFTVERFVATCYPLRRAAVCTVSRAKIVVAMLTIIATGSYSYLFVMAGDSRLCSGSDVYQCFLNLDYIRPYKLLNSLDTIFALVIPVALIIGLNFQIGIAVWHFEQVRRRMTTPLQHQGNGNCSVDSINSHLNTQRDVSRSAVTSATSGVGHGGRYQIKITKMLLMISSVFVGLNAPSYIMRLYRFHRNGGFSSDYSDVNGNSTCDFPTQMVSFVDYVLSQWFQLIYYLNFAINFLLYCVCGENFRKSLRYLFWKSVMSRRGGDVNVAGGIGGANSSRRQWSRRNTGTIVISTQLLMTESHPSPSTISKSRQQNVTSF
ncbi:hypothetical protein CHUAL_010175 [Chamberlinius hualienensis]